MQNVIDSILTAYDKKSVCFFHHKIVNTATRYVGGYLFTDLLSYTISD